MCGSKYIELIGMPRAFGSSIATSTRVTPVEINLTPSCTGQSRLESPATVATVGGCHAMLPVYRRKVFLPRNFAKAGKCSEL